MKKIAILIFVYSFTIYVSGSEQPPFPSVIKQSKIGENGCGPCAVINSLQLSGNSRALNELNGKSGLEKTRAFIAEYGNIPSILYGDRRTAYSDDNGCADVDLTNMFNRFAKDNKLPLITGTHIQRNKNETAIDFVRRFRDTVSRSIDNGFHPILSVRALAAEYNKSINKHVWNSKGGHWIAIHSIKEIENDGASVTIQFSDSLSGELQSGFVYLDLNRPASVPLTFTVNQDGDVQWEWVKSSETLTLMSPGMPLGTKRAKWMERTFIAIRYLVYQSAEQVAAPDAGKRGR